MADVEVRVIMAVVKQGGAGSLPELIDRRKLNVIIAAFAVDRMRGY
jgi:hypothetical protein